MLDPNRQRHRLGNSISSRRVNSRTAVRAEIFLRQSNVKLFRATLSDISISGFKLDSYTNLDDNKLIFITLPGLQTLGAHIKWVDYQDYGCEFTDPLHPAVLEHLLSKLQKFGSTV